MTGVDVFHAGTKIADGNIVSAGGRVLSVTAVGANLDEARDRAYAAIGAISIRGSHFRSDIALKASQGLIKP
jgi:phosphoribosylamine--glycine ligase